ncbi:DUF432 domain-containing protein [Rheinheimera sediminis]|uniref:DUF432 domain-containing protein n=1 Tax=Rheinheimera sp. YQF-1 TaxID=2499626 RepID=UPI000FD8BF24|nr:DUF432 domain-containing protein [Rheinheimera sp. YQF-1]RVT48255.1 DUF432 domain-containing protein [Rheinheimera sp. YQF-1]
MFAENQALWWQPQTLLNEQSCKILLGPLHIVLQRKTGEWWLATERVPQSEHQHVELQQLSQWPQDHQPSRFVFQHEPLQFCLRPLLADRPVVVKTHQPVYVPPGEQVTFYISSPVSIRIELQQPNLLLQEIQTQRLSDTWFGPNTQTGELCYADKTQARHSKEELPKRVHKAVTPVMVKNNSSQMMSIEKLSLPVPYLSLYGLADGSLWTDQVILDHQDEAELSELHISKQMPAGSDGAERLAKPRLYMEKHGLFRAFSDLFAHAASRGSL